MSKPQLFYIHRRRRRRRRYQSVISRITRERRWYVQGIRKQGRSEAEWTPSCRTAADHNCQTNTWAESQRCDLEQECRHHLPLCRITSTWMGFPHGNGNPVGFPWKWDTITITQPQLKNLVTRTKKTIRRRGYLYVYFVSAILWWIKLCVRASWQRQRWIKMSWGCIYPFPLYSNIVIGTMAVGCYIWYSEDGPGRAAAPPSPLLAVLNVTATHRRPVYIPTSYYLTWHYNCQCPLKG